jgi:hypothetical protein
MSKAALFGAGPPRPEGVPTIHAALYPTVSSWWFAVPNGQKMLAGDAVKPFNNYIEPVLPQAAADMSKPPLFVMKAGVWALADPSVCCVSVLVGDTASRSTTSTPLSCPTTHTQVDDAHVSIATLTDEPLSRMTSIETAPTILARVVGKGRGFASPPGQPDGDPVMPQVGLTGRRSKKHQGG